MNRREFVAGIAVAGIVPGLGFTSQKKELFEISLAQWSLHKAIFGKKMDAGDFPKVAKEEFASTRSSMSTSSTRIKKRMMVM